MKTITIKLYEFKELSEEAKKKVLKDLRNIYIAFNWWESIFKDAKNIGLEINDFDLDQNRHAKGKFLIEADQVAEKIKENHECETYKTAISFIKDYDKIYEKYNGKIDGRELDDEVAELETSFLESLLEDYSIMLQKESDYLQTDEVIIETIEANEWTFEENGKMNNVQNSEINTLLEKIYHEIDIECISETDTVKMESVKNVLAKYGARPSEME